MDVIFTPFNIIAAVVAYLMGSIPSAVWIGKIFYGTDIREHGSGNAGATNTFRVLGKTAGLIVLSMDVSKGLIAITLLAWLNPYEAETLAQVNFKLAIGVIAVLGHIFPIFAGFKGGKGVATLLGVVIALHWQAALMCIGIFLIIFLLTRYVSLGSMVTAISFPFLFFLVFRPVPLSLIYFAMVIAVLVLITHQKNIERLMRREENRMNIRLRKKG
ncbi:MAG TPA: acyl-phosphate glycerol 3-phosphate acyltransferase [Flavobacteriales bacterium]|nr:acyl-phosphate glycerol 3-phosphate acyltransferase [Flavobacteriales bacterium]HRE74867.1 glycerol-3-phosphate 1-O-acyltransferase PlsY [Flavobacteriales bacterium]HRE97472.1 glycerol-3-phosphate 1-O-acyltransferase PlsY [Flavobacteriales bacterium]HRJ36896.1 glycerol-3-phosphate 1-O-acyltransferase PlsY [Flavobacteriales bacterium]HRJ37908.1 glycerol-3-phosphate 1-O-acyltransferase PlsY [Flavobacteriales bacterium]